MSLFRLPFLASVAWGTHIMMTSPNPSPPPNETLPAKGFERFVTTKLPFISKTFLWATTFFEMAVIVLQNTPERWSSTRTVEGLASLGDPHPGSASLGDPHPGSASLLTFPFFFGWGLNLAGTLVRKECYRVLDKYFTFQLGIRKDHKLITSGPYALVRHPSYTGIILSTLGAEMFYLSRGFWIREWMQVSSPMKLGFGVLAFFNAVAFRVLAVRMNKEDEMMKGRFREEWEQWAARVPYKLVPFLY